MYNIKKEYYSTLNLNELNKENFKSLEQNIDDNTFNFKYKNFYKIIVLVSLCLIIVFSYKTKKSFSNDNILNNPVKTKNNNIEDNNVEKNKDDNVDKTKNKNIEDNNANKDKEKNNDDNNNGNNINITDNNYNKDNVSNIGNNNTVNNTNNKTNIIDNNNINKINNESKSNIYIMTKDQEKYDTNNEYDDIENIKDVPQIYYEGKKAYVKKEIIDQFNDYMDLCKKGILSDDKRYNLTKTPKISVIMPLYNGGKYLKYSLRSIQNQKLKNIEIIIINDCSTDDSLKVIENYMKKDPRIRLINNEQNRRILFSKSIGALYANGEYIIILDQDDMFITDDAFGLLYKEAKINNIDLIQFQDFFLKEFHLSSPISADKAPQLIYRNDDIYLEQPKIKNGFFKNFNFLLWGLLIKADIYKKIIYILWPIIINYRLIHYEDYHITSILITYAKNFRFMKKYFMVHLSHQNSAGNDRQYNIEQYISQLLFINSMINYHIKYYPTDIEMVNNFIFHKWTPIYYYKQHFKNMIIFILKNIYEYIPHDQKIQYNNKFNLREVKMFNTYEYFTNKEEYNNIESYQKLIKEKSKKNIKSISLSPKFTIILYLNETKFLKETLNSIENQNFDNFEVLIVCDNCNDLNKVNELIKDYINLELFFNKDNKGLLYSYSEAVLKSKGEYILSLKTGYTFATNDILDKLNQYLIKNNEDILEINLLINNKEFIDDNSLKLYKCSHFKSEINVDSILYNKNYKKVDQEKELIINKLIKSNIYKNIINEYLLLYKDYILYNHFDEIILYLLAQKNIGIKHVNINGIIEYSPIANNLILFTDMADTTQIVNDTIFYINFLFEHSPNIQKDKLFVLDEFYNVLNIIYNKNNIISEEGKQLIYKFLYCEYIPQYNKNLLKTYFNALVDRNKYELITEKG